MVLKVVEYIKLGLKLMQHETNWTSSFDNQDSTSYQGKWNLDNIHFNW